MSGLGGFAGALGGFFTGMGTDQQNARAQADRQRAMAMQQQQHDAQMGNYASEAQARTATQQRAQEKQAIVAQYGQAALAGDAAATARVLAVAPELAGSLTRPDPAMTYDSERGVLVNPRTGAVVRPANLPPRPSKEPTDQIQIVQGAGPDGKPQFFRVNKQTGASSPVEGMEPRAPGVSGAGVAQQRQALMMSAMAEARLADARMRKYEEGLLNGSARINPLQQAGGTLATNLSGTHGVVGSLMQAGSEGALNLTDPHYMQYVRDAQSIGRAESMVMPRGGNEAMVRSNSVLARAGTEAGPETINAARMARQALFGPSGGISQTMTPAQTQKLESGVSRIQAGDHGASSARPSLHDRVQQLKAQGMSRAQAQQALQAEGYDLHGGAD